ncbi:hypothetical protein Hanom_Chr16g01516051 [Helianthus anomalus]
MHMRQFSIKCGKESEEISYSCGKMTREPLLNKFTVNVATLVPLTAYAEKIIRFSKDQINNSTCQTPNIKTD